MSRKPALRGFDRFALSNGQCSGSDKMHCMGVTIELQNLGDEQLCGEITARIEHAFADRRGARRVSIIGSRASETWAIVEGPNGFERSYSPAKGAGQHEPDAIGRLILQLLPGSPN